MEDTKAKKSHKSSKKHKRSKKHKTKRRSSSSNSDVEMEWVEAPLKKTEKKRDSWMEEEAFVPTLSKEQMEGELSTRERKRREQEQRRAQEQEVLRGRELNPHWSCGGSGLPAQEVEQEAPRLPSLSVGDAGYAFLTKARLRIREQAERERRSMEEIAVERWGSLSALDAMIAEAEQRMHTQRRRSPDADRWHSPERSFKFRRPSEQQGRSRCNVSSSRRKNESSSRRDSEKDDVPQQPLWKKTRDKETRRQARHEETERELSSRRPAWKKPVADKEDVRKDISKRTEREAPSVEDNIQLLAEKSESPPRKEASSKEESLNRLAAKRMRAELLGDHALAARLKEEESRAPSRERVMLTKMDSSGQQRPISSSREAAGFERRTVHAQKRPNKYFDDSSSLKQMFEREKLTTTEDNLEMFLEVSAQEDPGKEDTETSGISKKATQKMSVSGQEEKDIRKAMQQHHKLSSALEKCELCLDQPNMKRHLIVSIMEQVFVCVPHFQSLVQGHCLIVPKRHVPSFLALDEDEWAGFQDALREVRRVFGAHGKSVVCMETSLHFGRCPHSAVECIPLPPEEADLAPLYFKKAILESEEEWAHNVKLVDLTAKGLRRSIPKNLPYFCVLFDPSIHQGYAHVIEDEKAFPRNFGKEVLGGMLDIDYHQLYKNKREDPIKKNGEAVEFTKMWEQTLSS